MSVITNSEIFFKSVMIFFLYEKVILKILQKYL